MEFRDVSIDGPEEDEYLAQGIRIYRCRNGLNMVQFMRSVDKAVDVLFCRVQPELVPDVRCRSIGEVVQFMRSQQEPKRSREE